MGRLSGLYVSQAKDILHTTLHQNLISVVKDAVMVGFHETTVRLNASLDSSYITLVCCINQWGLQTIMEKAVNTYNKMSILFMNQEIMFRKHVKPPAHYLCR